MTRVMLDLKIHYETDAGTIACDGYGSGWPNMTRDQKAPTCGSCLLWLNRHGHHESTNPAPRARRS